MSDIQHDIPTMTGATMTGLEILRAMLDGRLPGPSIAETLGFTLAEIAPGRAVFVGQPSDRILNPMGLVHGGWALTLIDSATGCAAHTVLPAGVGYTTVETKVNFARPIRRDSGPVRAEGRVLVQGRRIITADAQVLDDQGRIAAHGTSTLMVLEP